MGDRLKGKVALVTGAGRGQGEATARLFAQEGARVVVADLLAGEGEAVAASLGDSGLFVKLDIASKEGWQAAVAQATRHWGGIDVLINNAGINPVFKTMIDLEPEEYERVLKVNLMGPWLGIKTVAPGMIARGKGSIVNIVSTQALYGMNGLTPYQSSKWGLRGLSKAAALELGHQGVRVNAVFPGGINTPMGNVTGEPVEQLSKYYTNQPIRRIGEPIEVAYTSLFLASDEASYLCGAEIAVDGGATIGTYTSFLPGGPAGD